MKSRVTYRAPVFYVTSEMVKEPNGITARRDMVRHPGSVVVMAVDDSGKEPRVLLIRQFRYAAQQKLWEFPAGRIDPGEDVLAAAKRELAEETGFTAKHWKRAMFYWASPGFLDETMSVYLATGLSRGKATPEEDEVIHPRMFPLSAALKMALNGSLKDGKTLAGVLWLSEYWKEEVIT